jgi:hypothetical protein
MSSALLDNGHSSGQHEATPANPKAAPFDWTGERCNRIEARNWTAQHQRASMERFEEHSAFPGVVSFALTEKCDAQADLPRAWGRFHRNALDGLFAGAGACACGQVLSAGYGLGIPGQL